MANREVGKVHGRKTFVLSSKSVTVCKVQMLKHIVFSSAAIELISEEADMRITMHTMYAACDVSSDEKIVVRSLDTVVFIFLLANATRISQHIMFETGRGTNQRRIDVNGTQQEIRYETAQVLPEFQAFTRCDCTSAFATNGKVGPYKFLIQNNEADLVHVFNQSGSSLSCLIPALCMKLNTLYVAGMVTANVLMSTEHRVSSSSHASQQLLVFLKSPTLHSFKPVSFVETVQL
jgi:hypothetical protein